MSPGADKTPTSVNSFPKSLFPAFWDPLEPVSRNEVAGQEQPPRSNRPRPCIYLRRKPIQPPSSLKNQIIAPLPFSRKVNTVRRPPIPQNGKDEFSKDGAGPAMARGLGKRAAKVALELRGLGLAGTA